MARDSSLPYIHVGGRLLSKALRIYYSNGRPAHELRGGQHSTVFRARPGETIEFEKSAPISPKELVKKLIPGLSRK